MICIDDTFIFTMGKPPSLGPSLCYSYNTTLIMLLDFNSFDLISIQIMYLLVLGLFGIFLHVEASFHHWDLGK